MQVSLIPVDKFCEMAFGQEIAPASAGHRDRTRVSGRAQLSWTTARGDDQFLIVKAFDVSEAGFSFESPMSIPLRTRVAVMAPALAVQGSAVVRHCSQKGLKYLVGIEFSASHSRQS